VYTKDERGRKRLNPDRYEFLVYRELKHGLDAGDISCRDSVRFRSFEDDLIDAGLWRRDKENPIAATGLVNLRTPIRAHLAELEERLEGRIVEVNRRILSGENDYLEIHRRGANTRWTLQSLPASEPINHSAFETLDQTDIADVLRFVHRACGFLDAFDHVLETLRQTGSGT
jgi:hypothetical protein